jgi:hypothetical protein
MDQPTLTCQDERRRQAVRDKGSNGIDYVEVVDGRKQLELGVHLFRKMPDGLQVANVRIEGGRRIRDIQVTEVWTDSESDDCLRVRVNKAGDFSPYTLRLIELKDGQPTDKPYNGFDPRYAKIQFGFKAGCPSDLDCKTAAICPPEKRDEPEIGYLAKDYASFRQLILDRLALIMPGWQERHVPDIGIALVEVLAYVGDYLSYYQDAVATEAYLDTARRRISVRRHARLVDYQLHEGCNSRTWVTVWTSDDVSDASLRVKDIYFTTEPGNTPPEVFEPLVRDPEVPLKLLVAHNAISFYTWADQQCCLPRGATSATLRDGPLVSEAEAKRSAPNGQTALLEKYTAPEPPPISPAPVRELGLEVGDILIFEEVKGPKTGDPADANPLRRHVVRLTTVEPNIDSLNKQPVVEIEWADEDALPFPLCLSARKPAPDCSLITEISVARGNVILVDHGQTIDPPEDLGQVGIETMVGQCACEGSVVEMTNVPDIFRPPALSQGPLTFSEPLPTDSATGASLLLDQDPRKALPCIAEVIGLPGVCPQPGDQGKPKTRDGIDPTNPEWRWYSRPDLLDSQGQDQHFVVEIDNDGRAHLRFGDGDLGRMPDACMIFTARYRTGNGPAGNVGAEAITTLGWRNKTVSGPTLRPRNPLPARGGTEPEPLAEVKLFAPRTFLKEIERAITADDYARLAERNGKVQRAGASLRWTGSWYAAQVAIDPFGSETADQHLLDEIEGYLYRYHRMGHDLEVWPARYVPLAIEMQVCVLPNHLRGDVEVVLLDLFSNRMLLGGGLGFFHPDNLTFGDGVYMSKLVAAAQKVSGVQSVLVTKLQRLGEDAHGELEAGVLALGPLEIAQLDNDSNFPEHGTLKLNMGGGR